MAQFYDKEVEIRLNNIERILDNVDVSMVSITNESILRSMAEGKTLSREEYYNISRESLKVNLEEIIQEIGKLVKERTDKNAQQFEQIFKSKSIERQAVVANLSTDYKKNINNITQQYIESYYLKYKQTLEGVKANVPSRAI
ncbi:MAG: hypothetical protein EHM25_00285 [Nitrosopumilales archaeon]|nr:MAG: hypothetical protein EHM25_12550 [Nitrosopumilales archaeon]RPJ31534.1 MAG: hypothetical protein EHM25_02555 [Nitrosopumilales archaeon]RPJ32723.1 MAG: hypothetical protein EHM25_00285 [Nitrosopumilales archaeon]